MKIYNSQIKKKSVGINAIINGLKTFVYLAFPLITYPYISRVLGVDNVGVYNFSHSVIDYFYLLSALGISTYAIREGTKYRDSRIEISRFASEIFSINVLSTIVSYLILGLIILFTPKLQNYAIIIGILSVSMVFTTVGCEWIYTIYEEYSYIAIRTISFQIISLILLFLLVKTKDDVRFYAITVVVSNSGANIVNLLGIKKHCDIRLCFNKNLILHLTPILILFANSVATRIYVNSDITILGFLSSDYDVGIYTISSKIYSIAKQILSAVIIVSIPRLSYLIGQGKQIEYQKLANIIVSTLIVVVVPSIVGLFCLSKIVVLIISTEEFASASTSLCILSFALLFCLFNWFYSSCVLIPNRREKRVLQATVTAAILNVVLNLILIPFGKGNAAAFTTLIAECCSLCLCIYFSRDLFKIIINIKDFISVVVGCLFVYGVCSLFKIIISRPLLIALASISSSIFIYCVILFVMKNSIFRYIISLIKNKFFRKTI